MSSCFLPTFKPVFSFLFSGKIFVTGFSMTSFFVSDLPTISFLSGGSDSRFITSLFVSGSGAISLFVGFFEKERPNSSSYTGFT
jgi:hypothetical protein